MKRISLAVVCLLTLSFSHAQHSAVVQQISNQFANPLYIISPRDGSGRLFVVQQAGQIIILPMGFSSPQPVPYLDITDRVQVLEEGGLLGLAFHPQFTSNRRFFVHYISKGNQTIISEFQQSTVNPEHAEPLERVILAFDQIPSAVHKGGMLAFGSDGYLYIGTGDGGSPLDAAGNAQNLESYLGKILRIDVDHGDPYTIPADNPFIGATPGLDEIFALGVRNPYRFSFDRVTGTLFLGDVGEEALEEVDIVTAGGNFGWNIMEGDQCLNGSACDPTPFVAPIYTYAQTNGRCAVVGGYVYRGADIPWLVGKYVFGDVCSGEIFALEQQTPGGPWTSTLIANAGPGITSFGEDQNGELLMTQFGAGSGVVSRISDNIPATTDLTGSFLKIKRNCPPNADTCRVRLAFKASKTGDAIPAAKADIYFSRGGALQPNNDFYLGTIDLRAFRAGTKSKRRRASFDLPPGLAGAGAYMIIHFDPDDTVHETNELNNVIVSDPMQ